MVTIWASIRLIRNLPHVSLFTDKILVACVASATDMCEFILQILRALLDVTETAVDVGKDLDGEITLLDIWLVGEESEVSTCLYERCGK